MVSASGAAAARRGVLLTICVVLIGLALRPFLTGLGPIAGDIAADLAMSPREIALVTLLPFLLMGAGALCASTLRDRFGERSVLILALAFIALGNGLRLVVSTATAMIGTAILLGAGVAVIQALFPATMKREFPERVPLITGLYSASLMGGGALGAQASPMLFAQFASWRPALGWLTLPALLALAVAWLALPRHASHAPARVALAPFVRSPVVWVLMLCFGLINAGYSSAVAWLPASYQALGWSKHDSGALMAQFSVVQAMAALAAPLLSARMRDRRLLIWLCLAVQIVGFALLAFWPLAAPQIATLAIGTGLGGCFSLMILAALAQDGEPSRAGAITALMQAGGFLIAALSPWVMALCIELTGGYWLGWSLQVSMLALAFVLVAYLA